MMNLRERISDPIGWLVSKVKTVGLEGVFGRYYGIYRGIVIDNNDPENRGRVRVQIPSIGHRTPSDAQEDIWALPCQNGLSIGDGQLHGVFYIPDVNDQIFVVFERGMTEFPIYLGGWVHSGEKSLGRFNNVNSKGIRTKTGHTIELKDDGGILISKGSGGSVTSTMLSLGEDNDVVLSSSSGAQIYLSSDEATLFAPDGSFISVGNGDSKLVNSSGSSVSISGGDVDINASGNVTITCGGKISLAGSVDIGNGPIFEPAVTGQSFATSIWATHTHVATSLGSPTTPPVTPPPAPSNGLSSMVRISK